MPTSVLVRDPPRTKDSSLPIFKGAVLTSYSGIAEDPPIPSLAPEVGINQLNNPSRCHSPPSSIVAQQELEDLEMAKKRRSLQALLIPSRRNSIIPSPDGSPDARMRSRSNFEEQQTIYYTPHIETETVDPKSPTVTVEQSSDWLDEDPFANLSQPAPPIRSPTAATVLNTISRPVSPSPALKPAEPKQPPRSPLTSTSEARRGFASQRSVPNSPRPTLAPLSPRVRPATTRPAFAPRPSLPSLSTLATMNVVIPKKVRKGRVGAGLPYEPWDIQGHSSRGSSARSSQADLSTSAMLSTPSNNPQSPSHSLQPVSADGESDSSNEAQKGTDLGGDVDDTDKTISQPSSSRHGADEKDDTVIFPYVSRLLPGPGAEGDSWNNHSALVSAPTITTTAPTTPPLPSTGECQTTVIALSDPISPPSAQSTSPVSSMISLPGFSRSTSMTWTDVSASITPGDSPPLAHALISGTASSSSQSLDTTSTETGSESDLLESPPEGDYFSLSHHRIYQRHLESLSLSINGATTEEYDFPGFTDEEALSASDLMRSEQPPRDVLGGHGDVRRKLFAPSPFRSFSDPEFSASMLYESGASVDSTQESRGVLEPPISLIPSSALFVSSPEIDQTLGAVDGEWNGGQQSSSSGYERSYTTGGSSSGHGQCSAYNGGTSGAAPGLVGSGSGGHGRDGDDGNDDRRRRKGNDQSAPSSSMFAGAASDDETSDGSEDESTDDYGRPGASAARNQKQQLQSQSQYQQAPAPLSVQPRATPRSNLKMTANAAAIIRASVNPSESDDDVPLAKSIPTALTAQKTIRRQVREERDQRRKDRALRVQQQQQQEQQQQQQQQQQQALASSLSRHGTQRRPHGAGTDDVAPLSNSQEAALAAEPVSLSAHPTTRQRTQTMPNRPFSPEDLVKKLQSAQNDLPLLPNPGLFPQPPSPKRTSNEREHYRRPSGAAAAFTAPPSPGAPMERPRSAGKMRDQLPQQQVPSQNAFVARGLRPSKSFHRPSTSENKTNNSFLPTPASHTAANQTHSQAYGEREHQMVMQQHQPQKIGRSLTQVSRPGARERKEMAAGAGAGGKPGQSSLVDHFALFKLGASTSSSGGHQHSHSTSNEDRTVSSEKRAPAKLQKALSADPSRNPSSATAAPTSSSRTSSDAERSRRPSFSASRHPPTPVPPLPISVSHSHSHSHSHAQPVSSSQGHSHSHSRSGAPDVAGPSKPVSASNANATQQRVFIGDMQRFNLVEVTSSTTAGDVVEMVDSQGGLKGWVGTGGWMLFEVAQDFGMERPIRSYELLADVQTSWNKDKMVNTFMIKLTLLAEPLSRSAMPTSSPLFSGMVEWESKKGKWSKRWMQLREHNLYLSKRDRAKEEVFLCSLSNFDAYYVTRPCKAPKPFVFAIKSTDNLALFENSADYLHVFACQAKDGEAWMQRILLARSYVLHQERNILFNPKGANNVPTTSATGSGAALSRAGTRKNRPPQPLLDVAPPNVFEPGSLLHKRTQNF